MFKIVKHSLYLIIYFIFYKTEAKLHSIYVAVPSISDTEFLKTMEWCVKSSSGDIQINIGAVGIFYGDETEEAEQTFNFCKDYDISLKILNRNRLLNKGTGIARKTAMAMYDGEDYMLQIDSHSIFMENWDSILIDKLNFVKDSVQYDRVALSAYPPEYKYIEENRIICPSGWHNQNISKFFSESFIYKTNHGRGCAACEEWSCMPSWNEVNVNTLSNDIIENYKISGAYLFADKNFVKDYNSLIKWNYAILEEELIMSIEAHSLDWKFFTVKGDVPLAHLYAEDINDFSGERSTIVEDDIVDLRVKLNYLNYVLDPRNKEKIERFERYANVDIINLAESEKSKNEMIYYPKQLGKHEGSR